MAKQIKKYSKIALAIALTLAITVMHTLIPQVQAGTLTGREVRLDDSRISDIAFYGASTTSAYDFQATGTASNIECIKVWFCNSAASPSYDGTNCTKPTGMNFDIATTTRYGAWNNLTAANWDIIATGTNYITASTTVAEQLGNSGSWVFDNINNPSATGTYYTWIYTFKDTTVDCLNPGSGDVLDSGVSAFAVFQGVTVTATINETLNVTVNASSCNELITGSYATTSSATTSIGFGNIITEQFYDSCQRIDIGTNAATGYIARIHKTQALTSAGSDVILDGNCDGACATGTAAVWQTNTKNGFGYCMRDKTGHQHGAIVADSAWASSSNSCGVAAGTQFFKVISNTTSTAESFMQSNKATSTNQAFIGYRLTADSAQPAGTYTTEIIYTVTPKF